jgi:hypothetical protein
MKVRVGKRRIRQDFCSRTRRAEGGTRFATPGNKTSTVPDIKLPLKTGEPFRAHAFELACAQNDIDHRLTKPRHPWTTDEVEYPFRGAVLFSARLRMTSRRRVGLEVKARPRCLHCRSSFEASADTRLPRLVQPWVNRLYAASARSPRWRSFRRPSQVVRIASATLSPAGRLAGAQFEISQFLCVERGPNPCVVLAPGEKVPDDDGDFASNGDGSDMGAASPPNAVVKGSQWPGGPDCLPPPGSSSLTGRVGAQSDCAGSPADEASMCFDPVPTPQAGNHWRISGQARSHR